MICIIPFPPLKTYSRLTIAFDTTDKTNPILTDGGIVAPSKEKLQRDKKCVLRFYVPILASSSLFTYLIMQSNWQFASWDP
jgi:hypothetical protein